MHHEFSFDTHTLRHALKIGALIAVIFISARIGSREGSEWLASAGSAHKPTDAMPDTRTQTRASATSTGPIPTGTTTPVAYAYLKKTNLPAGVPVVEGAGAIAVDIETGAVLFEKNRDDMYPTASVAKLMTAVIARETLASSSVITAGADAIATYGNTGGIVRGESFRAADLLYGLLLPSSNDAARMFELSGNPSAGGFVLAMNAKAAALDMTRTHYADSSGLKEYTVSSVSDLARLLRYIYLSHPEIMAASRTREYVAVSGGRRLRHIWDNVNWPGGDARFLGGKAGFTDEAIETMAGIWLVNPSRSGPRPTAVVILGSHHRVQDVRTIISYIEKQFTYGTTTALTADTPPTPRANLFGASLLEAVREYLK